MKINLILLFAAFLFLSACVEDPNDVGFDLLPDRDKLTLQTWNNSDTPIEMTSETYQDSISTSYSKVVLLGQTNAVKSTLLLKSLIILPDSIQSALEVDSLTIISVHYEAAIVYSMGNGTDISFTANKINEPWVPTTFTLDSLAVLDFDNSDLHISHTKTDSTFEFSVQPEIAVDWLKSYYDSDNFEHNGLLLQPSNTDLILGFPALSSSLTDSEFRVFIEVEKPNEFIDTLIFNTSADLHLIQRDYPTDTSSRIVLQAGTGVRGKLRFNLADFPKNSIINKAILRIFYDETEADFGSNPSDTLQVYMLSETSENAVRTDVAPQYLVSDTTRFSGVITEFMQRWIDYPDSNLGLQLRLSDELDASSQLKLYPADYADSTQRPYLEIIYTRL